MSIDCFEWMSAQLADVAAGLKEPMTAQQWAKQWVDISIAAREDGESEENASVLADHLMCEHFGTRPEEAG